MEWMRSFKSRVFHDRCFEAYSKAFPEELHDDLSEAIVVLIQNDGNVGHIEGNGSIRYRLFDECIRMPYRNYFDDISCDALDDLTSTQRAILSCIYTRNCDGYVREKYLKEVLQEKIEYWQIPFIVKLCDEYVLEILETAFRALQHRNNEDIKEFCLDNKDAIRRSYSRMISYWDVYYRREYPILSNYIGKALFRECFGYNRSFER